MPRLRRMGRRNLPCRRRRRGRDRGNETNLHRVREKAGRKGSGMKHGFRKRLSPNHESQRALYDRLEAITHEQVHAIMIGGSLIVSQEMFSQIVSRCKLPNSEIHVPLNGGLSANFNGLPVYINPAFPFSRKRGSPHRERWRAKMKARRDQQEKLKRESELSDMRNASERIFRLSQRAF